MSISIGIGIGINKGNSAGPRVGTRYILTDGQTWLSTFSGTVKIYAVGESGSSGGGEYVSDVFAVIKGVSQFSAAIGSGGTGEDTTLYDEIGTVLINATSGLNGGTGNGMTLGIGPQVINAGGARGQPNIGNGGGGGGSGGPLGAGNTGGNATSLSPGIGGASQFSDGISGAGGTGGTLLLSPTSGRFPGGAPGYPNGGPDGEEVDQPGTVVITVLTVTPWTPDDLDTAPYSSFSIYNCYKSGNIFVDAGQTNPATNGSLVRRFIDDQGGVWDCGSDAARGQLFVTGSKAYIQGNGTYTLLNSSLYFYGGGATYLYAGTGGSGLVVGIGNGGANGVFLLTSFPSTTSWDILYGGVGGTAGGNISGGNQVVSLEINAVAEGCTLYVDDPINASTTRSGQPIGPSSYLLFSQLDEGSFMYGGFFYATPLAAGIRRSVFQYFKSLF